MNLKKKTKKEDLMVTDSSLDLMPQFRRGQKSWRWIEVSQQMFLLQLDSWAGIQYKLHYHLFLKYTKINVIYLFKKRYCDVTVKCIFLYNTEKTDGASCYNAYSNNLITGVFAVKH